MFAPRIRIPKIVSIVSGLVLAACSTDRDVVAPLAAPSATAVVAPASPSAVAAGAVVATRLQGATGKELRRSVMAVALGEAVTFPFTVTPTQSTSFIVGAHMVNFPAYTICNPATSGFGPNMWMHDCSKQTQQIVITATTWTDANGRPQIDFANDIRFYPNYHGQLPAVYLRDASASMSSWGRIDYCSGNGSCVNEAATDGALATQRDASTGFLFRLVHHFSGYNVWA
ncbi:MAG: hypothetical protein ABIZ91_13260 [Gemmatimonadaceae bacterium]